MRSHGPVLEDPPGRLERDLASEAKRGAPLRAERALLRAVLRDLAEFHGVSVRDVREALVLHALAYGDVYKAILEWKLAQTEDRLPGLFVKIEFEDGPVLEEEPSAR